MPINSKQKGKDGELELSHKLRTAGYDTRRSQQFCGAAGDADVVGIPGLHIECKRVESLNVDKAYEQACSDSLEGLIPVVMHRKNRQSWKVTLSLADFILIYKAYQKDVEGGLENEGNS